MHAWMRCRSRIPTPSDADPGVRRFRARSVPVFHAYLGAHSLLIGLLPFFLPVYLWGQGFTLAMLSAFIGVSGLAFCAALSLWQFGATHWAKATLVALSFALEVVLVAVVLLTGTDAAAVILLGIANGLYNAFFWTTQRTLFAQGLGENDSGRQFGNFQIFVAVFLKVGILAGGLLLDRGGVPELLLLSAAISVAACLWFRRRLPDETLCSSASMTLLQSHRYRDPYGSKPVFIADGLFLFLESHFWTLSLFLLVDQDFTRLGLAVILLALVFAALFYLLKNMIDHYTGSRLYQAATGLYLLSWLLRAGLDPTASTSLLLTLLVLITFCTSLFRLAFNKRFFDHARQQDRVAYLLVKSYLSQFWLGAGFLLTAAVLTFSDAAATSALTASYLLAALLCPLYLRYRPVAGHA